VKTTSSTARAVDRPRALALALLLALALAPFASPHALAAPKHKSKNEPAKVESSACTKPPCGNANGHDKEAASNGNGKAKGHHKDDDGGVASGSGSPGHQSGGDGDGKSSAGGQNLGGLVGGSTKRVHGAGRGKHHGRRKHNRRHDRTDSPRTGGASTDAVWGPAFYPTVISHELEAPAAHHTKKVKDAAALAASPLKIEREMLVRPDLVRAAVETAHEFAFPMGLALMVIVFLVVQNRIDRDDPKLAVAPVTSAQETLAFL
jgi:hypothetical protein